MVGLEQTRVHKMCGFSKRHPLNNISPISMISTRKTCRTRCHASATQTYEFTLVLGELTSILAGSSGVKTQSRGKQVICSGT